MYKVFILVYAHKSACPLHSARELLCLNLPIAKSLDVVYKVINSFIYVWYKGTKFDALSSYNCSV